MKYLRAAIGLYLKQLIMIGVTIFSYFALYIIIDDKPKLFSFITGLIYVMIMYSACWNMGKKDGRNIPGFYPDKMFPVKVSLIVAVIPVILLLIRVVAPNLIHSNIPFLNGETEFFVKNFRIYGVMDFIYRFYFLPFVAFIPNQNIFVYALAILILPTIVFAGYYVGLKRFKITEFISENVLYKKK